MGVKMELKFTIDLTLKEMYEFMLRHTYCSVMGVGGVVFSVASLIGLFTLFSDLTSLQIIMLIITGSLFTVINPVLLYWKSKKQFIINDSFKKPLSYTINDKGIDVAQEEVTAHVNYDEIMKVISTKNLIIIYMSPVRAFIMPKAILGTQIDAMRTLIQTHIHDGRKVLIKP